jgi:hypothetical protein
MEWPVCTIGLPLPPLLPSWTTVWETVVPVPASLIPTVLPELTSDAPVPVTLSQFSTMSPGWAPAFNCRTAWKVIRADAPSG